MQLNISIKNVVRYVFSFALLVIVLVSSSTAVFAASDSITKNKAVSIALDNARVNESSSDYKFKSARLAYEDSYSRKVWTVRFTYDETGYTYVIDAKTEKILDKGLRITRTKIKAIARKRAEVDLRDITSWNIDFIESANYYKVVFTTRQYTYSVRIHASSGAVLRYLKTSRTDSTTDYVGINSAKAIAVKHAKTLEKIDDDVIYTKARIQKIDGVDAYLINFSYDDYSFRYEISASSGKILDYQVITD